ncbi:MAG: hypothetical protein A2984_02720 [Omnitrophica WOR_2 bacterium RIFCSPLOWO2_01_FULL_41_12]|nr:MAG: hypothetical protein A2984_02720 [Omnitrophica WOR_2 bacterium RIFCSPLOWO2_01_FULL_41_12]
MLRKIGKRAQTTAEYAILIALVVGAVVAMQVYLRRGLQGRVKDVVDDIDLGGNVEEPGKVNSIFTAQQYEPYYVESTAQTAQNEQETENLQDEGALGKTSTAASTAARQQTLGWQGE